jgi:nitrate reductase NapD
MPECTHISSAVICARPADADAVAGAVAALPGIEIHAIANGRIVVVMEAADAGALGGLLAHIALMDGVLAANMVFEQALAGDDDAQPLDANTGEER